MIFSIPKTVLIAAVLSSIGVDADRRARQDRTFVVQVSSENTAIDGAYLIAQQRSPTYGTVLSLSSDSATPFYYGKFGGLRNTGKNGGRARFAEQTSSLDDSRVYFATVKYGQEVGSGFDNVTCTLGEPMIRRGPRALTCTCGDRTGVYGCAGTDENSGLFIYNTANAPEGPTTNSENCALISGLTAIPPASTPELKLIEVDN